MLARWFDRNGIGQRLAPDPDAEPVSEDYESRSLIWQILAPDDNFPTPSTQAKAPPAGIFPPPPPSGGLKAEDGRKVMCIHCHQWTDVGPAPMIETIPASPPPDRNNNNVNVSTSLIPQTPTTPSAANSMNTNTNDLGDLNTRVLTACRDTSMYMKSPKLERKANDKFLRFCASTMPLNEKLMKRMRTMIEKDSYKDSYLLRVRATKLGETAPDGYTSLQVTAYANHIDAAKLILKMADEYAASTGDNTTYASLHLDRDMFGMTALHIAGERGHVEMIQFLLPLYKFPLPSDNSASLTTVTVTVTEAANKNKPSMMMADSNLVPLIDLGGQTAFGRAVTSPVPKAKKNQRTLEKKLFSKNDLSIFGQSKPIGERMGSIDSLGLQYGTSDMPGCRGYMEDAMSIETWRQEGSTANNNNNAESSQQIALLAVCDGHGDNGLVSQFVASNASRVLRDCMENFDYKSRADKNLMMPSTEYWSTIWHSACLQLDHKLREAKLITGGSTGVFALITEQEIIVANVGDSRCILVCEGGKTETTSEENASAEEATNVIAPACDNELSEPPVLVEESTIPPAVVEDEGKDASTTAVVNTTSVVTALSEDHKPNLPDEVTRIEKAGFKVDGISFTEEDGKKITIHKVVKNEKDQLAVSRAFGDFDYKANPQLGEIEQAVIPIADVQVHTRDPKKDLYLVLACDGIWDVMENNEVMDVVQQQVKIKSVMSPNSLLPDVADVLLQKCLHKGSRDNMSAILVSLHQPNNQNNAMNTASPTFMPPKALDFGSPK